MNPIDWQFDSEEPVSVKVSRGPLVRALALASLTGIILWQLATRELPHVLAREWPETALRLRHSEPLALLSMADRQLNSRLAKLGQPEAAVQAASDTEKPTGPSTDRLAAWARVALNAAANRLPPGTKLQESFKPEISASNTIEIRREAEIALQDDTLNARAARILGQLADAAGDEARATRFMQLAASRSRSESAAIYWLMQRSAQNKRFSETAAYADVFLRKRPQLISVAMPFLTKMAEHPDPAVRAILTQALVANPPWRAQFLSALPNSIRDARTPLAVLLALQTTEFPPATTDLEAYFKVLLANKLYDLAYYTWLQFLPPERLAAAGQLFNGSFEWTPTGAPFDWSLSPGAGVTVDLGLRSETTDQHALILNFGPGRVEFSGVSQILVLSEGRYRLKGLYKGEIVGGRGLQWQVRCEGQQTTIGESAVFMGARPNWAPFEFNFQVPVTDCQAQDLRLVHMARSASEQLLSGKAEFDEFELSRIAPATTLERGK